MSADNQQENPKICVVLDGIIDRFGRVFAWLNVLLIVVIIVQVVLRYAFGRGVVILEELQFHFYGVMLILAISYTLVHDGHIRLELGRSQHKYFLTARSQAIGELQRGVQMPDQRAIDDQNFGDDALSWLLGD